MKKVSTRIEDFPATALCISFGLIILIGAFVLMMPFCHAPGGAPVTFSAAAFTATSATCVTGLAVLSTPNDFSFWGQLVILLLIQCGGIGIMTIAMLVYLRLFKGDHPELREVADQTLGVKGPWSLGAILKGVVYLTLGIELVGGLILAGYQLYVGQPFGEAIWWGTFHSISAFCNGGFALHNDSLSGWVSSPVVSLTIAALIMLGATGYPIARELLDLRKLARGQRMKSLSLHFRITVSATIILVVGGAVLFWLIERHATLEGASGTTSFLGSLFQSVTTRTAGFNTLPLDTMTNATLFLIILLMAIGANSCSTGGGIKVSTVSIIFIAIYARLRGHKKVTVFNRTIRKETITQALVVITVYGVFLSVGFGLILLFQQGSTPHTESGGSFLEALFESVSALATVGLSTGYTGELTEPSRWVIMAMMFAGRVGPLAIISFIALPPRNSVDNFPEESPLIG